MFKVEPQFVKLSFELNPVKAFTDKYSQAFVEESSICLQPYLTY
jgi:hypothetical protein